MFMKISEQEFIDALDLLQKQFDWDSEFDHHMEKAFPGSHAPIYDNSYLWNASIKLLEIATGDQYGYIESWVFERNFGRNGGIEISWMEDGKKVEVELKNAQMLYSFLRDEF